MFPPSQGVQLDVEAISGICGSISIACWIVVFSPQIIENFKRSSADGLSLQFIIVWLAGDVFNILGAILQGVLPTMLILAIYYTLADIVLLGQCFYYRGFTWKDEVVPPKPANGASNGLPTDISSERTALLHPHGNSASRDGERRPSTWSSQIDATHLSPVTPLLDAGKPKLVEAVRKPSSRTKTVFMNLFAVLMVCLAGVLGWWLSRPSRSHSGHEHRRPSHPDADSDALTLNLWGQIFGYFCAVLYLGSRIPQILLNYRRKSTEGISMLFFLFACIGNLTYVLSILAFDPTCRGKHGKCAPGEAVSIYGQYILVNASWLAGSLGTLFLDFGIFVQFFLYREKDEDSDDEQAIVDDGAAAVVEPRTPDDRPLLQRGNSGYM